MTPRLVLPHTLGQGARSRARAGRANQPSCGLPAVIGSRPMPERPQGRSPGTTPAMATPPWPPRSRRGLSHAGSPIASQPRQTHNGHDASANNAVQEVEVKYQVLDFAGLLRALGARGVTMSAPVHQDDQAYVLSRVPDLL